jgi:hypothetical protein
MSIPDECYSRKGYPANMLIIEVLWTPLLPGLPFL